MELPKLVFKTACAVSGRTLLLLTAASGIYAAPVTFTDSVFNLANWDTPVTYSSDPGFTTAVSQTFANGNPAPAVQFFISGTGSSPYLTQTALVRPSFVYDPSVMGAVNSVDFSIDKFYTVAGGGTLTSSTARLVVLQGGNYYIAAVSGATAPGLWNSFSSRLASTDFNLFDFTSGNTDTALHPDFNLTGGAIEFGIAQSRNQSATGTSSISDTFVYDNLTIAVNTPEPAATFFAALGLTALFIAKRRPRHISNKE